MQYIPTIGLEIHAELKTASKMFCACKNDPDEARPNINICSICLGHPGTLPVLNRQAIKHVLKLGIAIGGELADFTEWDRKNYFYPDIPKGYQITQYKYPLVSGGSLADVALERIHLEEDTARSTHDSHEKSLVDFNRSGVPLMELVTRPVIHDAATAMSFAEELQMLLRYLGAGEANMEKGEMRVEANISVASESDTAAGKFGTKTEVKNLNSFRSVGRAIEHEIARQIALLESGGKVIQETRGWDDSRQETYSQRTKESSHDYRYFPDPDIPKLKISEIPELSTESLRADMPELPWEKRARFGKEYGMTDKEVAVFVGSPALSSYYESVIGYFRDDPKRIKLTTNYILSDYLGLINRDGLDLDKVAGYIPAESFAALVTMVAASELSSRGAKDLLPIMLEVCKATGSSSIDLRDLADKHGLIQKSDAADIIPAIEAVIAANTKVVEEYRGGKTASLQFLIGQAMKATKGAANPEMVRNILIEKLT